MTVLNECSKLSVLLVTYNHETYIRRALESLFKQEYPGAIELVIADDASTDGTLELIRTYERLDPRFIFSYLPADINVGITKNYQRGFAACTGEYVAVLEGDDYWVSPKKLSRQLAFLEGHWECDLCSVNYFVRYEANATFSERTSIGTGYRLLNARDLIADNVVGNFSTCMYRKSALDTLPAELFEVRAYDWIVNICVAMHGLIGFLEEPMSVYRVHSSGAWSNYEHVEKLKLQLSLIPIYDQLTQQRFHAEFNQLGNDLRQAINLARLEHLVDGVAQPASQGLMRINDFMPPLLTSIVRAFTPPILARLLLRIARRGRLL
ncbi:glycosyltransferase [Metapseudomonas otitidis]|uniref:glycosyltransferase n=1 Tax=Metapseudomonas otitidis TaxID=319939 RepID=UPI003CF615CD